MIHPNTRLQFISPEMGYGVFATDFIPRGTIVYVKDTLEQEISPDAYASFTPEMQSVVEKYSYIDPNGNYVLSWDFAKYVNHCCNYNTISTGYGFEVAVRDIQPGEEITDEYAIFNLEYEMELTCSKAGCRRKISFNDFDQFYIRWDEQIRPILKMLFKVKQPLLPFLENETLHDLKEYINHDSNYRSVYGLKYQPVAVPVPGRQAGN